MWCYQSISSTSSLASGQLYFWVYKFVNTTGITCILWFPLCCNTHARHKILKFSEKLQNTVSIFFSWHSHCTIMGRSWGAWTVCILFLLWLFCLVSAYFQLMLAELYVIIIYIIIQLHICNITLIIKNKSTMKWHIPKNHTLSPLGKCIMAVYVLCFFLGHTLKGREQLFNKLGEWAQRHHMKQKMDKGKILHLGRENPWQQYGLGNGEQLFWKSTEVLVDGKLDVIPQCALEAVGDNCTLGYKIAEPYLGSQKKGTLGFFNPILNAASSLRLINIQKADKIDQLKQFQQRSTKTVRRWEHLSCEGKLMDLDLVSLEKAWVGATNCNLPREDSFCRG